MPPLGMGYSVTGVSAGAAAGTADKLGVKVFTANLAQVAGTYDLCVATGGDVWVEIAQGYMATAGVGFTTVAILTNHATPKSIVAALAAAATTLDLACTVVTSGFVLPSGKKIQYTIVGTGSAGAIQLVTKSAPVTGSGALV